MGFVNLPRLTFAAAESRWNSEPRTELHDRNGNVSSGESGHLLGHTEGHVHNRGMLHVNHRFKVSEEVSWNEERNFSRDNLNLEDT